MLVLAHRPTRTLCWYPYGPLSGVACCAHPQVKSRQLKKLFEKYQAKKAELGDLQEQFQREREVGR